MRTMTKKEQNSIHGGEISSRSILCAFAVLGLTATTIILLLGPTGLGVGVSGNKDISWLFYNLTNNTSQ